MSYVRPVTVYLLQFEDREGLEVRARSVPLGQLLELGDMAESLRSGEAQAFGEAKALFELFASKLKSWNLTEDDGTTPVPCDTSGLFSLEFPFATEILLAWFDAVASVSIPLGRRSTDGSLSVAPSIQTTPLEPLGSLSS